MKLLDNITDDPKQTMFLVIEGYDTAKLELFWRPNQIGWFFNLTWQNFSVYNQRITTSPNILRQYKNLLPFGLLVSTNSKVDPIVQQAFVESNSMYLMDSTDVALVESTYFGNV